MKLVNYLICIAELCVIGCNRSLLFSKSSALGCLAAEHLPKPKAALPVACLCIYPSDTDRAAASNLSILLSLFSIKCFRRISCFRGLSTSLQVCHSASMHMHADQPAVYRSGTVVTKSPTLCELALNHCDYASYMSITV